MGHLGSLRSAISIYYADNEAFFPEELGVLTVGSRYLDSIPKTDPLPGYPDHHGTGYVSSDPFPMQGELFTSKLYAAWSYGTNGEIIITCLPTDSRRSVCSTW